MKTNSLFIKQLLLNFRALRASKKSIKEIISLFLYALQLIGQNLGFRFHDTIAIEISNICNARCVWCWMYFPGKKDSGLMSFEDFKKLIDLNASYFKRKNIKILPYHRGEPLLHPCFFEMIDYCVKKGVRLRTLSTNLSVEIDIDRIMSYPFWSIWITLGGITKEVQEKVMPGTSFELVKNNLRKMFLYNKLKIPIYVKMNPTKDNVHQIEKLGIFVKELGGTEENAVIGTTGFSLPAEASEADKEIFFKNVVSKDVEKYLRFTYDNNKNVVAKKHKCFFLMPTIKYNGVVAICCHDQLSRINVGNAFKAPLEKILGSKEYKINETMGRRMAFFFCKNCN